MKKTIQLGLLLVFALTSFTSQLSAQDLQKEMLDITKKFEKAYNEKDDKALKDMFTENAVRTIDGLVSTGSEAIRASFVSNDFKAKTMITITLLKAEPAKDGSVTTTGSYRAQGKSETGEDFDLNGDYTSSMVKVNGKWKITKQTGKHW